MERPVIAVTAGDPAGIGPEIVVKALNNPKMYEICKPVVFCSGRVLQKAAAFSGLNVKVHAVDHPDQGVYRCGILDVYDMDNIDVDSLQMGMVQAEAGKAAFEYIREAIEWAGSGKADAVATAPINKEALKTGKIDFIGHTEIFAGLTGTQNPLTMFQVENLRVFFLTRHVSLLKACQQVKKGKIVKCLFECDAALKRLGVKNRLIAVAGLNPHCGEHGLFGEEEVQEIEPAVRECIEKGLNITGPVPADSIFHLGLMGKFDAILSLYHDQGHIATKTYDFEKTISITNGLPFLRTSVDHGTAFDIAGKGVAGSVSMEEAIRLAAEYAPFFVK